MSDIEQSIREVVKGDESNAELDKIVADLLLKEAREKNNHRNNKNQTSANEEKRSRKSLNTRFLNGIVRGVERHNFNLLSTLAVDDVESERFDKQQGSSSRQTDDAIRHHSERRNRNEDERDSHSKSHRSRRISGDDNEQRKRDHRSRRSHSQYIEDEKGSRDERRRKSRRSEKDHLKSSDRRSASPETQRNSSSKMDKYFKSDYDPMLDIDSKVISNSNGLIDDDDGLERALSVIQKRKREKEERRLTKKIEKERKRSRPNSSKANYRRSSNREDEKSSINSALKTQYAPLGSIREWDKGKK